MSRCSLALLASLLTAACSKETDPAKLCTVQATVRPEKVGVGGRATLSLVLETTGDAKITEETPLQVMLSGAKAKLEKTELGKGDATFKDGDVRFEVPLVAEPTGQGRVDATVSFWLCIEPSSWLSEATQICEGQERQVSAPFTVE